MARNTKGRIFQRGKKEVYYVQFYLNGKQIVKALKDDDGNSILSKRKAQVAADKLLAPYIAKDEIQRREQAYSALKGAKEKAQDIELKQRQEILLSKGWDLYLKSQYRPDSGDATLINYQRHYNKFIEWTKTNLNNELLTFADVDFQMASNYALYIEQQGYSRNTYNKHITFMKLFFRVMIDDSNVAVNPFERLKRKKQQSNSRKELNIEQINKLFDNTTGELKTLFFLGYFTGLRRGDCCTLQWSEVNLTKRIITRLPNKIKSRSTLDKKVKIGICDKLYEELSNIPVDSREDYVLPTIANYYESNKRDRINRMVKKHFEACGISTVKSGTGAGTGVRAIIHYGFHSLRYSYISHHAEAGTPQAIIQANAGHANPAMTEHYTKISDEVARKVANVLDDGNTSDENLLRNKLHTLIDTLSLDKIKRLLESLEK